MTALTTSPTELSAEDFRFVRDFLKREAAIALEDGKEYLVTSRLAPVVRAHGAEHITGLIAELRRRPASPLGGDVIDAMTTNETSFFRDIHPFQTLREQVLPEIIESRRSLRRLNIWCGAASSGQEPYTIAMVIAEHFPELADWNVTITATDISPSILAKAERGEYSQLEVNRGLPAPLLVKHFSRHGARWRINDDIRRMVSFHKLNLADRWPLLPTVDLIFMRNVLIYFDDDTKNDILRRAHEKLATPGYVILGGAETTRGLESHFERVLLGRSVWYRAR